MRRRDNVSGELLSFWRSTVGFDADFILCDHAEVEVKAKKNISHQDIQSLEAIAQEKKPGPCLCEYCSSCPKIG